MPEITEIATSEEYTEPLGPADMMAAKDIPGGGCDIIAKFHGKRTGEVKDMENSVIEMAKIRPLTVVDIADVPKTKFFRLFQPYQPRFLCVWLSNMNCY